MRSDLYLDMHLDSVQTCLFGRCVLRCVRDCVLDIALRQRSSVTYALPSITPRSHSSTAGLAPACACVRAWMRACVRACACARVPCVPCVPCLHHYAVRVGERVRTFLGQTGPGRVGGGGGRPAHTLRRTHPPLASLRHQRRETDPNRLVPEPALLPALSKNKAGRY